MQFLKGVHGLGWVVGFFFNPIHHGPVGKEPNPSQESNPTHMDRVVSSWIVFL